MSANLNEFCRLPLADIIFSSTAAQTERREHFDKAKLAELAESIKAVGIAQPILVRPADPDMNAFEVIAGERRVLAARQAGLAEIPAMVREISDEQLLELQLVENLQREDLHEMAEAEGYEELTKRGYTVDQIVEKVGKSRATVYARMKLLALQPPVRTAFHVGDISASHALLIARIPVPALQLEALQSAKRGYHGEPMSVRDFQHMVQRNYMLQLAGARFPTGENELIAGIGPCAACPKNTLAQPELFGEVKADKKGICTDPTCFNKKREAHQARLVAKARESGQTVITGDAAAKIFPYGSDARGGYVRLDGSQWVDSKNRPVRQFIPKDSPVFLVQHKDELIEVVKESDFKEGLKAKGIRLSSSSSSRSDEDKAKEKKAALEMAARARILVEIFQKPVETAARNDELRRAVNGYFERLDADSKNRLAKALSWDVKSTKGAKDYESSHHINCEPWTQKMGVEELWQFLRIIPLAALLGVSSWSPTAHSKEIEEACSLAGVDGKKIRAEIAAADRAKHSAKKQPKAAAPAKKPKTVKAGPAVKADRLKKKAGKK